MSRYSGLLERHRFQTYPLPPDKWMHILNAEQGYNGSTQVLYKKQGGSSGYLGGGSFGAVHLEVIDSECEVAPTVRAVKTINKRTAETSKVHWQQEVENLIVLSQYPNLFVKIFGWWEDEMSIFLPMEYLEASDLSRNKELIRDEGDIRSISRQLALGLEQMHSLNIIHRDIKPHNIFVVRQRPTWHVKIGDFGFSKRISDSVTAPYSARGTTKYMAPEYRDLMNNCESSDFTTAVDMWSFGCLLYELFAKKCPFDEDNSNALMKYVRDGVFPRLPLDDAGASSESIWLIMNLLERDPHLRLSAQDALHCAWLNSTNGEDAFEGAIQDLESHKDSNIRLLTGLVEATPSAAAEPEAPSDSVQLLPPKVVVVPDEVAEKVEDSNTSITGSLSRPSLAKRAISSHEFSSTHVSADDTALTTGKPFQVPELPPRPKSSNTMRPDILQDIDNTKSAIATVKPYSVSIPRTHPTGQIRDTRLTNITRKPVAKAPNISPPSSFPCLEATELSGKYIDMAFKNLKFKPQRKPMCDICESRRVFNPVIKPAALYYCKDCGNRPLCQRCIIESIRSSADPHEADHKLQAWIQAHLFPLQEFLERFRPLHTEAKGGLDPSYGSLWLSSDQSFTPPAEGSHGTRWILNALAGEFDISVQVRIVHSEQAINGSAIGKHKAMMVNAKAVSLGSILFGARVIDPSTGTDHNDEIRSCRHLPDRPVEQSIRITKEEQTITPKLGFKLKTTTNQKIEVHVRGFYDVLYFKAGSPFKWWLDKILYAWLLAEYFSD
ncbi:MAG: hypothetical protein Q9225_004804 [Loekoesia sp. 1 TL-2023]